MRFTETVLETFIYGVKGGSQKFILKASLNKPWLATDGANGSPVDWQKFARRQSVVFATSKNQQRLTSSWYLTFNLLA